MSRKLPKALYNTTQVRELDRLAIASLGISGLTLMRRAATACVTAINERWPDIGRVAVCCGSGNNAGDGYLIAGILTKQGAQVTVVAVGKVSKLSGDARSAYDDCRSSGVEVHTFNEDFLLSAEPQFDLLVDALLGTGTKGQLRPDYLTAIHQINAYGRPVFAVDLPSGLSADTGTVHTECVQAAMTMTFVGLKQGLLTHQARDYVGHLRFSYLELPPAIYTQVPAQVQRLVYADLIKHLPNRRQNSHKYHHGHVLVIGGAQGMGGAVLMAAEAAMRSGVGLTSIATHPAHSTLLLTRCPELMVHGITDVSDLDALIDRASVLVIGPGLGCGEFAQRLFPKAIAARKPKVVDADGLSLLAMNPQADDDRVLTPHPGEAARLIRQKDIQTDRFQNIAKVQRQYGGTVLLKGSGTLIHSGASIYLCDYGNPGMATAGMGDVLSGVIGGLWAQGCDRELATQLGTVVHGLAADQCTAVAGEKGLLATDLLPNIRRLINDL